MSVGGRAAGDRGAAGPDGARPPLLLRNDRVGCGGRPEGHRPCLRGRPDGLTVCSCTAGPYIGAIRVERKRSRRSITLCEAARSVHARLSHHRLRWHSNAHFRPPRQSVVLSGIAKGRTHLLVFFITPFVACLAGGEAIDARLPPAPYNVSGLLTARL